MNSNNISHLHVLNLLLIFDLILILCLIFFSDDPKKYFAEWHLITWISFIKLLAVAYINWNIFATRKDNNLNFSLNYGYSVWLIVAFGFLFLGLDEILLIHENSDKAIHKLFKLQETSFSDRIDDLIVLIYAMLGILILYSYKDELLKFTKAFPYLFIGFLFLFVRIFIDFITNRNDIIPLIINDDKSVKAVNYILALSEGTTKLIAETFFITAFYLCLKLSRKIEGT